MRHDGTMLITARMDACVAFYADLLGGEPSLGAGWAQFDLADGTILALHSPWQEGMATEGGSQVTLLLVDSVAEEAARLSALGIACSEPHEIPGGAVVTLTDPDGRTLQLIERTGER